MDKPNGLESIAANIPQISPNGPNWFNVKLMSLITYGICGNKDHRARHLSCRPFALESKGYIMNIGPFTYDKLINANAAHKFYPISVAFACLFCGIEILLNMHAP